MIEMRLSEAAHWLQASFIGDDVTFRGCSTDTRTLREGSLFIALRGENFDGHDFIDGAMKGGAAAAMVEHDDLKPVVLSLLQVDNTREAMGALAARWRRGFNLPVIAVTGSNGKTTVKEMLTSILSRRATVLSTRGNFNNDIGVPLTLFDLHAQHDFAVIEMGANHPGEIARLAAMTRPSVALITLCASAHLQGFGSIDGIAAAKAEIFSGLAKDGIAVINADDKYAAYWQQQASGCRQLTFALESPADLSVHKLEIDGQNGSSKFTIKSTAGEVDVHLNLLGLHNVRNALAAAACCVAIGIPLEQISEGLQIMHTIKGRMQATPGMNNSLIIDDTYNANPASLQAAVQTATAISKRCWLVLGEMRELGDAAVSAHCQAGEDARRAGIERLYTLGELGCHAVRAFGSGARHYSAHEQLISALVEEIEEGITLLVKGSRAMKMEQVVQALAKEL